MAIILTFWTDGTNKQTPDDYESGLWIHLKSVKQIPTLVAARPANCTMISTEYSADHKQRGKISNPKNPRYFKEIWKTGQPVPQVTVHKCPLCGHPKE